MRDFIRGETPEAHVEVKTQAGDYVDPTTSIKATYTDSLGERSSEATTTTSNHLIDTVKNQFVAGDVGKTVYNITDDTTAVITVFNSSSDVTLDTDIMVSGEEYEIYCVYAQDMTKDGTNTGRYNYYYTLPSDAEVGWWTVLAIITDGTTITKLRGGFRVTE